MADNFQFTNNASALLAASISDSDTTITLETGFGALFPNPSGSQEFRAALQNADGDLEIVQVTGRATDVLTVVRGQEGTTAQAWTLGVTRCELRLTEETMEEMLQKNGGTMTGALDMDENDLVDARINGTATVMEEGQIVGVPLRGTEDDSSNEVAVPNDGTRATASGSAILTQADLASNGGLNLLPINTIVMWYGSIAALPTGWQQCDGTNGTPDMRDNFPVGAGSSYSLGATGGSATASGSTDSSGGHTHGGSTGGTSLTVSQLPDHQHGGYSGNNFERGVTVGSYTSSYRQAVVIPGFTKNDGLNLDAVGTNSIAHTNASSPLTTGMVSGGSGSAHSHSISSAGAHTHTLSTISILPPYVALHFIMKVS